MSQVVSTILYNGQFWIALVEKYEDDGSLYIGKHTFGPEPNNSDILDFYRDRYERLKFYPVDIPVRIKKQYSRKELERNRGKSFAGFKAEQKKYLMEKKRDRKILEKESQEEKYRKKAVRKKEKKRGR